jgi:transposase
MSTCPTPESPSDKFHVIAHANEAVDQTRRREQRTEPKLRGLRRRCLRTFLGAPTILTQAKARSALHGLITAPKLPRTARAWVYKEQLRQICFCDWPLFGVLQIETFYNQVS